MTYMLTGGSGKLGQELQKFRKYNYIPTHDELDITDLEAVKQYVLGKNIDLIVHCAAYTNVTHAEIDRLTCYKVNVEGTKNLAENNYVLYVSSEYAAFPNINHYSFTKRLAEQYADKSIRLLFKPRPFPHSGAFTDQWTSGDYVDVIAREVDRAIDLYEELPKLTCIGTGRKSIYHLAMETRPDVACISRTDVKGVILPEDTSMDTTEWERIKNEHNTSSQANG